MDHQVGRSHLYLVQKGWRVYAGDGWWAQKLHGLVRGETPLELLEKIR
jgi:hypothetical protein